MSSAAVVQQTNIPRLSSVPVPPVTSSAPTVMAQSPADGPTHGGSPLAPSPVLNNAPKYGTLVPNRIFVGGISSNTTEVELAQLFSVYGNVKSTKIISDRAGVSKGYGFVTFEQDEEAKRVLKEAECIYLRDRKLNIAPAIKKQPFSRSFEEASPSNSTPGAYFYSPGNIPAGYTFGSGMTYYNHAVPPTTAAEQPAVYQGMNIPHPGAY